MFSCNLKSLSYSFWFQTTWLQKEPFHVAHQTTPVRELQKGPFHPRSHWQRPSPVPTGSKRWWRSSTVCLKKSELLKSNNQILKKITLVGPTCRGTRERPTAGWSLCNGLWLSVNTIAMGLKAMADISNQNSLNIYFLTLFWQFSQYTFSFLFDLNFSMGPLKPQSFATHPDHLAHSCREWSSQSMDRRPPTLPPDVFLMFQLLVKDDWLVVCFAIWNILLSISLASTQMAKDSLKNHDELHLLVESLLIKQIINGHGSTLCVSPDLQQKKLPRSRGLQVKAAPAMRAKQLGPVHPLAHLQTPSKHVPPPAEKWMIFMQRKTQGTKKRWAFGIFWHHHSCGFWFLAHNILQMNTLDLRGGHDSDNAPPGTVRTIAWVWATIGVCLTPASTCIDRPESAQWLPVFHQRYVFEHFGRNLCSSSLNLFVFPIWTTIYQLLSNIWHVSCSSVAALEGGIKVGQHIAGPLAVDPALSGRLLRRTTLPIFGSLILGLEDSNVVHFIGRR